MENKQINALRTCYQHHHKWNFSLYQNCGKQKPMPQKPLITPSIITHKF
jgi:hypothetical protein